jgi:hypothetical protein
LKSLQFSEEEIGWEEEEGNYEQDEIEEAEVPLPTQQYGMPMEDEEQQPQQEAEVAMPASDDYWAMF